jgi:hypothetical protein
MQRTLPTHFSCLGDRRYVRAVCDFTERPEAAGNVAKGA